MNIQTNQIIKDTIQALQKASSIPLPDNTFEKIAYIINKYEAINNFYNGDESRMVEARQIKKHKEVYLKRYIDSFEHTQHFYNSIGDINNSYLMELNKWIFDLYTNDIEKFTELQSEIYTTFLASPDLNHKLKMALRMKETKRINDKTEKFIQNIQQRKYIQKVLKFFAFTPLSESVLKTSLTIEMYKTVASLTDIKKNKLKEILETMLFQLDITTTIQLNKVNDVIVRTIIDELPIYAYRGKKQIKSVFDFDEIEARLSKRIMQNENNPQKQKKYEEYLNNKISSKRFELGL